ncbi:uncharacterized protein N7511_011330 [Penicillium nucicola]|uniref:uncharacterized protein n=1 Tax=Penicillium nucicola TaxID=1850975 RepID=UPI002544F8AA|nr:uncharacterized protein N7511_011254 [Penicillium nucicola]XP_056978664.1 uncharacterized protein N7511_011330 [Penicillium nucicola]KAJ5742522.1 hypothetical protein N7511_011254 [Penicillium nucicola]KAJ5742598.1 hypothetical protein N7511_011330 [Penicillium nucicola]
MHQDIAPRNLLIDPETDKIILFDFDWATNEKEGLLDSRDDVSGVVFTLYEIITNDSHPTSIPHRDRNIDMFRKFLNEWIMSRTEKAKEQYFNAPKRLTWPDLPTPPDYSVPFELGWTEEGETVWQTADDFKIAQVT